MNTASLKQDYQERIVPILMKEFNYTTVMQCPKLTKIVLNQGLGDAVADKKIIDVAQAEMTAIAGQKAVATLSKKDIANFKVRKKMPIGVRVTLRGERMYEWHCLVSATSKVFRARWMAVVTTPSVSKSRLSSLKLTLITLPNCWV